jgi:hypothetical protein
MGMRQSWVEALAMTRELRLGVKLKWLPARPNRDEGSTFADLCGCLECYR